MDEGEILLYISKGLMFNFKDERLGPWDNFIIFKNSLFRLDRLSLIKKAVRFTNDGAGEIKTDDLGRIIRIRPSLREINQLLSDIEYDENGNIAKIVYSDGSEDDVVKIVYTYDSYGNWTMAKITTFHQSWIKYSSSYGEERNKEETYFIREISYYSDNDKTLPASLFVNEEEIDDDIDQAIYEEKIDDGTGQPIYNNVDPNPTYPEGEYRLPNDIIVGLHDKYKSVAEGKYPEEMDTTVANNVWKKKLAHIEQLAQEKTEKTAEVKREREVQEEAERICSFAYDAIDLCDLIQEYNKLSKISKGMDAVAAFPNMGSLKSTGYTLPNNIRVGQIVNFEVNGILYTFIKKDKTTIHDVHFNRIVHDLDYSYHDYGFLSDDNRFALITHHNNRTNDCIYLVEFEGNEVKSISSIPYKKSKDFIMPQL